MGTLLAARHVSFAYARSDVIADLSLDVPAQSLKALVGPNGSGKTTLLRLFSGILQPRRGTVEWDGMDLRSIPRREMARRLAFVPQQITLTFALTVQETVMLGRTPHLRAFAGPTRRDKAIVDRILRLTETDGLADKVVTELSGGEKQRVIIAMALAQEPQVLLLDEPTVHLDINHQIEILKLLQRLNRENGVTVLATMHDLNLAALYFEGLAMIERGRVVAEGAPAAVLSAERIQQVFGAPVQVQPHPDRADMPLVVLRHPSGLR